MISILNKLKKGIEWLLYGLALVGGAFLFAFFQKGNNREMLKKAREVKKEVQKEQKKVEKIRDNIADRKEKDKKLVEKLKKHFHVFLVIILLTGMFSGAVMAQEPSIDNLKIPDDYDALVDRYKEMALIALEYQKLYRETESDNEKLLETIENLQKLIKAQEEIIDQLLKQSGADFGVITGINFVPADPLRSGLVLGVNWKF